MGVGGQHHALATLAPGNRPGTHCTVDWVDPNAGLDRCRKAHPHLDSISGLSSSLQVTIPTTLSQATLQ
jgi:hypothetical protein